MSPSFFSLLLFSFLLSCLLFPSPSDAKKQWVAGFSNASISPTTFHRVCLGGYGSCPFCRQTQGIHDDIYVRVFYLNLDGDQVTFVSLDIIGMSNLFIQEAIALLNGIVDTDRVIMSSTHSHATPDLVGLWGWVPDSYRSYVLSQIQSAVIAAKASAQPAALSATQTYFNQTNNRRGWASTDYGVTVIWANDPSTSDLIGLVVNFGAHPTVLGSDNHLVSRDWVSGLIDGLEETLGAGKAMYVNAAQGDVSPRTSGGSDDFQRADKYGRSLASTVLTAISQPSNVLSVDTTELYFVKMPFRQCVTNSKFLLAMQAGCMDYDFISADSTCPRGLPGLPPKMVETQVAYVRLGTQVQIAIVPGEALSRLALDGVGSPGFASSSQTIKSVMTAPVQSIWGLSSDFLGYFVPGDEWNQPPDSKNPDNSHYEEGVSLGEQADFWIRDRVKSLIVADQF